MINEAKTGNVFVSCDNITYHFTDNDVISQARKLAINEVKKEFDKIKSSELSLYEQALESGAVLSVEEYEEITGNEVAKYLQDFDEYAHETEISSKTGTYLRNYYDLPYATVVEVPETTKDSKDALKAMLENKFGVEVSDIGKVSGATKTDIAKMQSYDAVTNMMNSENYKQFLDLRASLNKYSFGNVSLIYSQKPDAQIVMSLTNWNNKFGRSVIAGEKGIGIYCPMGAKEIKTEKGVLSYLKDTKSVKNADGTYSKVDTYPYGKPDSAGYKLQYDLMMKEIKENGSYKSKDITGFTVGYTFDVSQTQMSQKSKEAGKEDNLEDIINLNKPIMADIVGDKDKIAEAMENIMSLSNGAIQYDNGKSEADVIFDAVKNYSEHIFANSPSEVNGIKTNDISNRSVYEVETSISAYLVAKHLGIESADKVGLSLSKIIDNYPDERFLTGKRSMFKEGFDRGVKFAEWFNEKYDKEMNLKAVYKEQVHGKMLPIVEAWTTKSGDFRIAEETLDNGSVNYIAQLQTQVQKGKYKYTNTYEQNYDKIPERDTVEKELNKISKEKPTIER